MTTNEYNGCGICLQKQYIYICNESYAILLLVKILAVWSFKK